MSSQLADNNYHQDERSFPFVDQSIEQVLNCQDVDISTQRTPLVDPETLEIRWNVDEHDDLKSLQILAVDSDRALLDHEARMLITDTVLQSLLDFSVPNKSAHRLSAGLLALNRLESAIRRHRGYTAGRAPLLMTMLREIEDPQLSSILGLLLLPNTGLNLRNLAWHGFLNDFPRVWSSLCILLIHHLLQCKAAKNEECTTKSTDLLLVNFCSYSEFQTLLLTSSCREEEFEQVRAWLPPSHREILDFAWHLWHHERKHALSIALLSILLEHGLRTMWCRINNRPKDLYAQNHRYYVTLDGHGQQTQHDLLLHPYMLSRDDRTEQAKNRLVSEELPGAVTALAIDLFASSCGGPNIRANLSHGAWDVLLERELVHNSQNEPSELEDLVVLVWESLKGAAGYPSDALLQNYRPVFSYAAETRRNLQRFEIEWKRLHGMLLELDCPPDPTTTGVIQALRIPDERILELINSVKKGMSDWHDKEKQTAWSEFECNKRLASCGAARSLLEDVVDSMALFADAASEALQKLSATDNAALSSRQRRRCQRICALTEFAASLYVFAAYVSLLAQRTGRTKGECVGFSVLLKAVERSRMVVSTASNFLTANSDRAIKAAVHYAQGNAVKQIIRNTSVDA